MLASCMGLLARTVQDVNRELWKDRNKETFAEEKPNYPLTLNRALEEWEEFRNVNLFSEDRSTAETFISNQGRGTEAIQPWTFTLRLESQLTKGKIDVDSV
ncbi:hypothetical protein ACH5RR_026244 [Cinchona calisaya]|uniref:Uncharacterized protein n=1 Tax=Cinchona calisaya TaxID=153742 RepID=A0ABD2Z614_9GENT